LLRPNKKSLKSLDKKSLVSQRQDLTIPSSPKIQVKPTKYFIKVEDKSRKKWNQEKTKEINFQIKKKSTR
jgi:hypothetical protein